MAGFDGRAVPNPRAGWFAGLGCFISERLLYTWKGMGGAGAAGAADDAGALMREQIIKYLFLPLKAKRNTKLFCFYFELLTSDIINHDGWPRRRPAVVYDNIE